MKDLEQKRQNDEILTQKIVEMLADAGIMGGAERLAHEIAGLLEEHAKIVATSECPEFQAIVVENDTQIARRKIEEITAGWPLAEEENNAIDWLIKRLDKESEGC